MNSKILFTVIAVTLLCVGVTWLIMPSVLYNTLGIQSNTNLEYMGRRYSAYILGLVAVLWMARNMANTQARRAFMIGCLVALALTAATSLYGAVALGLNTWLVAIVELLMVFGFVWVLFIKPEPVTS